MKSCCVAFMSAFTLTFPTIQHLGFTVSFCDRSIHKPTVLLRVICTRPRVEYIAPCSVVQIILLMCVLTFVIVIFRQRNNSTKTDWFVTLVDITLRNNT